MKPFLDLDLSKCKSRALWNKWSFRCVCIFFMANTCEETESGYGAPARAKCCTPTAVSCFDAFSCVRSPLAFAPMTIPELRAESSLFNCAASALCCTVPRCQRLRVVVLRACPWAAQPGAQPSNCNQMPNQDYPKCQPAVTSGMAFSVNLAGTPSAMPIPGQMPVAIQAAYPTYAAASATAMLEFDFGLGCSREATGKVFAMGLNGAVSASLAFTYTWCGAVCKGTAIPTSFTVTDCTFNNVRFEVLDTSFRSNDPCVESYVILEIKQYCCRDEAPVDCRDGCLSCVDNVTMKRTLAWTGTESVLPGQRRRYYRPRY